MCLPVSELIFHMSGVYRENTFPQTDSCVFLDFSSLDGTTFFCEAAAADAIRGRIAGFPYHGLHWIDSGDYHYLSLFWLEKIDRPFTLMMLDHHSDLQESAFGPDLLSCGSWLLQALKTLPMLKKVILIGPEDEEVSLLPDILRKKVLFVREEELDMKDALIDAALAEFPVYLSFDKDVLDPAFCMSGWTQGSLTPELSFRLIGKISRISTLLGADLCGETPPACGTFDAEGIRINSRTNRSLGAFLRELL